MKTQYGNLEDLFVTYYYYKHFTYDGEIGPFKTREEAEASENRAGRKVYGKTVVGVKALQVLREFELQDRIKEYNKGSGK